MKFDAFFCPHILNDVQFSVKQTTKHKEEEHKEAKEENVKRILLNNYLIIKKNLFIKIVVYLL